MQCAIIGSAAKVKALHCDVFRCTFITYQKLKGQVSGDRARDKAQKSLTQRKLTHSFECEDGASAPAHWASQLVQANTDTRTHIHTHSLWNQTAAESNEAEACWAAERLLQLVSCSLILISKLLTRHPLFHTIHTVLFLTAFYQWLCRVFSHRKARITEILNKL